MPDLDKVISLVLPNGLEKSRSGRPIRVLGIDLGTTNSTASTASWRAGGAFPPEVRSVEIVQPTLQGDYTHSLLPSVVALYNGQTYVGEGAKRLRSRAAELGLKPFENLFYECKNEMGIKRTYHRAPEGYRSPPEIGAKVIDTMIKAAGEELGAQPDRVVITVPASFQTAQRMDTQQAAQLAGLNIAGGDLLDEPVAAFLDYVFTSGVDLGLERASSRTVVVFDFGGGTCDVAVFRLKRTGTEPGPLGVEFLAVSRYHRLGGGDIDAAVVHECLIPELCRQNHLNPLDLGFEDKKKYLEPALLGTAEMLKEGLCTEIQRLMSFDKYEGADKTTMVKTQPGTQECRVGNRSYRLTAPKLSTAQLEELLDPFLDQDLLYARETEYRMTCSLFAPLQDALDRAGLEPRQVDYCLMVGGSSLIPQVRESVGAYFSKGELLLFGSREDYKTCISRGAAIHAVALEAMGRPLVQPICHDEIAIRTQSGRIGLISKGSFLPFPADGGFAYSYEVAVPNTTTVEPCNVRVELATKEDDRQLFSQVWSVPGPVTQGTPIRLEYRMDENQVLQLKARLDEMDEGEEFSATLENPLTHVVNPNEKRLEIDRTEEDLRTGRIPKTQVPEKLAELSKLYAELNQLEKAIDFIKRAIAARNPPDVFLLNRLAAYYGERGDSERQEKVYREATRVSTWSGSWFNLALALWRRKKFSKAREAIDQAIEIDRQAPYLVLAGLIAGSLKDSEKSQALLSEAMDSFDPVPGLDDFELGWFVKGAQTLSDQDKLSEGRAEQLKRSKTEDRSTPEGELPVATPGLMRTAS